MEQKWVSWTRRPVRLVLSITTVAALAAGAGWHVRAATDAASEPQAVARPAQSAPATNRVIAGGRDSYADIVKVVAPAVVTIRVESKARMVPTGADQMPEELRRFFEDPFGQNGDQPRRRGQGGQERPREYRRGGLGSGVVVTPDGYVLTNFHVVNGADSIEVELTDSRTFKGKVIGTDEPSDLALVKIEATNLQSLKLGDSDSVEVGDVVLAIGNPLGIGQTVTMGIISAKGRHTGGNDNYEEFLQTDAPINQGNSGGALISLNGELVGINSQIASMTGGSIGIGFAIPANMARHVMTELKDGGRVRRAQLGVSVQDVTADVAASLDLKEVRGALVNDVAAKSAAEHAGVKQGDVIVAFAGKPVRDVNSLRNRVAESEPGTKNSVTVLRDGREQTLSIMLGEREEAREASAAPVEKSDQSLLGVSVAPLTAEMARRQGIPTGTRGILVQDVDPDGRAASAGIRTGDIIQQVDRQPVSTVDELRAAVKKVSEKPALLLIAREGKSFYVTVRPS